MKFTIGVNAVCETCKLSLVWLWNDGVATLKHGEIIGLEYCPNFGKEFYAPTVELTEKLPLGTMTLGDLLNIGKEGVSKNG